MRVRITWNAGFGRDLTGAGRAELAIHGLDASATGEFDLPIPPGDAAGQLEALFEATNLYRGELWKAMTTQGLPAHRSHTALSVGDVIEIDGCAWRCDPVGWSATVTDPLATQSQGPAGMLPADPAPPRAR